MSRSLSRLAGPAAVALAAGALAAACGSSGSGSANGSAYGGVASPSTETATTRAAVGTALAAGEPVIHIQNFMFGAPSAAVKAGVPFMVVNDDSVAHTYEATDGAFDSHTIAAGASATLTVPKAGTYSVKCDFHPNMHGTLNVS
jgi:plastocyanin